MLCICSCLGHGIDTHTVYTEKNVQYIHIPLSTVVYTHHNIIGMYCYRFTLTRGRVCSRESM